MLHIVTEIKKYGVPNNFLGGFLESMLKVFVKHPCQRTRKMLGDLFLLDMCNRWSEYRLVNDYIDMYQSPADEILPEKNNKSGGVNEKKKKNLDEGDQWIIGKPKFRFEMVQNEWHTVFINKYGSIISERKIFHPFYDLEDNFLDVLRSWITNTGTTIKEGQVPTVCCHFHMKCKYDPNKYDQTYIYIDVHQATQTKNGLIASRTFLWLQLCYEDTAIDESDYIFVLAKPLTEYSTPPYKLLECLGCDTLVDKAKKFEADEVIGPVSVFPAVNIKRDGSHNSPNERKQYLDETFHHERNSKYVVIPNQNEWKNMGWTKRKYNKFLLKH